MRIGLVVERFEPTGGGVESAVWQTAHALAEAGDEVRVFARSAVDTSAAEVERIAAPTAWQPLRVALFARRTAEALARARASGRLDVVHTFSRVPGGDCFHAGGGSHAHYMRRTYGARGSRWRRLSPRHAALLSLEARVFADPSLRVQCVSRRVADELRERFDIAPGRLCIVPYGVDVERFRPCADARAKRRAELGAGEEAVWLFAGSGWRRKGLDTALAALARARDPSARLWIAGRDEPAPWRRLAARLGIEARVHFLGPRDDLEGCYAACDALLLPTRYDAFGMVCLEAAASGIPVVTSRAAGAAELLGDAGCLVDDAEDARAFARALDRLADARLRERLGDRGRAIALEHTWRAQTGRLRALYASIVDARRAAASDPGPST